MIDPHFERRGFLPATTRRPSSARLSYSSSLDHLGRDLPSLLHDKVFRRAGLWHIPPLPAGDVPLEILGFTMCGSGSWPRPT